MKKLRILYLFLHLCSGNLKPVFGNIVLLSVLICTFVSTAESQSWLFAQYYFNPQVLNPALTGYIDGKHRASVLHRSQWDNQLGDGFRTFSASYDQSIILDRDYLNSLGVGGGVISDVSNSNNYSRQCVFGSGALHKALSQTQFLSVGLQLRYFLTSVETSNLTFENQFNGADGFDMSMPVGESFDNLSKSSFDFQVGLLYTHYLSENTRFKGGFSIFNIMGGNDSFSGLSAELPTLFQIHTMTDILISGGQFSLHPHFNYMRQSGQNFINTGTLFGYEFAGGVKGYFGLAVNSPGGIVLSFGGTYKNVSASLAYDTQSGDTNINRLNSVELQMGYIFVEQADLKKQTKPLKYF